MLTLGDETFIADAVMLGDEQIDGGWMTMQPTVISHRSFVGNGSYIPDGTVLPEHVLIGVHTHAPRNERCTAATPGSARRRSTCPRANRSAAYPEHLTFQPSLLRRLGRSLVEAFRIVAPHAMVIAVGYTVVLDVMPIAGAGRWGEVVADLALPAWPTASAITCSCWRFKWLLLGRYRKRAEPMWTPFVWLSEGVTNLYEGIAVPNFMRYLRGTPWLPVAFRLLGCKIGKRRLHGHHRHHRVRLRAHRRLQRTECAVLPADPLVRRPGDEDRPRGYRQQASIMGPRSAVLYSAKVGDNARLGPLTLVMKGEHIPAGDQLGWSACGAIAGGGVSVAKPLAICWAGDARGSPLAEPRGLALLGVRGQSAANQTVKRPGCASALS